MYNKEEKNNPASAGEQRNAKTVPPLNPEQERERKKKLIGFIFYSAMLLLIFTVIYFLFFGKKETEPGEGALQTDLPAPAERQIGPKAKEYEQVEGLKFFDPAEEQSLEDMFDEAINSEKKKKNSPTANEQFEESSRKSIEMIDSLMNHLDNISQKSGQPSPMSLAGDTTANGMPSIAASAGENSEIKELKKQIAELKIQQQKDDVTKRLIAAATGSAYPSIGDTNPDHRTQDHPVLPVKPVKRGNRRDVVSSLSHAERRGGFYGFGTTERAEINTIRATTYGKQVIESGQNVRVRTAEPMQVGSQILPAGSILTGVGTVAVDRLYISFSTVEYNGVLTAVSLDAYDADGQRGLFVPGSMEMDAIRELGTELATSLSQTASQNISVIGSTQSAAEELKKNLGQGTIQGVGRFAAKKLARIRITIQDGHHIFIVPDNNK